MLRQLLKWFTGPSAAHIDSERHGYDWAAGRLLRGSSPDAIEGTIDSGSDDPFDRGVLKATFDWCRHEEDCKIPTPD